MLGLPRLGCRRSQLFDNTEAPPDELPQRSLAIKLLNHQARLILATKV